MNNLSNRLSKIYELINPNNTVCDLCSDHGLIPIELIKNKITTRVIATDIKEASIDKINNNINKYLDENDKDKIIVKLGDGLKVIGHNEFDILIISGIGCDLMINILSNINEYNFKYLLLSPQTKINKFREYLIDNNLYIDNEYIVYDDKNYYFIIKAVKNIKNLKQEYKDYELLYSRYLLNNKDKTLYNYMNEQLNIYNDILNDLKITDNNTETINKYKYLYNLTKNIIKEW